MPEIQINNEKLTYNNIIYVDCDNGNDANGDGSADNPYKTLRHAIHSRTSNNDCIVLKPGKYIPQNERIRYDQYTLNIISEVMGEAIIESNSENQNVISSFYDGAEHYFYGIKIESTDNCFAGWKDNKYFEFHNCHIINDGPNDRGFFNTDDSNWTIKLYNSYFQNNDSLFEYYGNIELYNTIFEGSNSASIDYDETSIIKSGVDYKTLSKNSLPSDLENQGTGTNPDGTQANIGVYGGPYAWGQWIELYHLFNDNGDIKTYNTTNNIWNTLGTDITEQQFLDNGLEDLNKLLEKDVTKSYTTTTSSSLGEGLEFEQEIDFSQFESIDSLEVK